MLERIVEGIPSLVHFAVGGAAGGQVAIVTTSFSVSSCLYHSYVCLAVAACTQVAIAGGSSSLSAGEERISSLDMLQANGR